MEPLNAIAIQGYDSILLFSKWPVTGCHIMAQHVIGCHKWIHLFFGYPSVILRSTFGYPSVISVGNRRNSEEYQMIREKKGRMKRRRESLLKLVGEESLFNRYILSLFLL